MTKQPETAEPPLEQTRAQRVSTAARGWQRKLAQVGGSNTLLWYRDQPTGTLDLTTAHPGGVSMLMAGRQTRLSDLVRESSAFVEARQCAEAIRDKALELSAERGLVTGFLAVGMATWRIPHASVPPLAPVLLRAVTLRPTDPAHSDYALDLAPRVELNPVLVHYLRYEHGVPFDAEAVAELAHVSRMFDPGPVYREVSRLGRGLADFTIVDRRIISTFPYAKLDLVADLAAHGPDLAENPVVAALAGDPEATATLHGEPPKYPGDVDPNDELLVLDADADQQRVVEAVRAGENLLVRAPAGTGVTQTIANAVAAAAADGKRVLLVAQHQASLDSAKRRLGEVGLGSFLLTVREGAYQRAEAFEQVMAALDAPVPPTRTDLTALRAELVSHRDQLRSHQKELVARRPPWDVSVLDVQTALAQLAAAEKPPVARVRLTRDVVLRVSRDDARALGERLASIAAAGAWEHGAHARPDPWYAARLATVDDAARAARLTADLAGDRLEEVRCRMDDTLTRVGLPVAARPSEYGTALTLIDRVRAVRAVFTDEIFTLAADDLSDLMTATGDREYRALHPGSGRTGRRLGWWHRRTLRRQARALLRPRAEGVDLHDELVTAAQVRADWTTRAGVGVTPAVPDDVERVAADWASLEADLRWLAEVLASAGASTSAGPFLEMPMAELRPQMARLAARNARVSVLPEVLPVLDDLTERGLRPVMDEFAARGVEPEQCRCEVELIWWASVLEVLAEQVPAYGKHDGVALRSVRAEYARLDDTHIRTGADRVRSALHAQLARARAEHPDQEAFLQRAVTRSRPPSSAQLLLDAPDVVLAATPVWAMSPLVVASVVPPRVCFDLVIVEGGAQVGVPESLGGLLRARQILVFGDEKQVGPRPFAVAVGDGHPPAAISEPSAAIPAPQTAPAEESLASALADILPTVALSWNHRNLDERLIGFANDQWYGGGLITVPGTARIGPVRLVEVSPEQLLDAVVTLVRRHAHRSPGVSLGVLTMDVASRTAVIDALRHSLAGEESLPVVGFFAEDGGPEAFAVADDWGFAGLTRDHVIAVLAPIRRPVPGAASEPESADDGPAVAEGPAGADGPAFRPSPEQLNAALSRARHEVTVVVPGRGVRTEPGRWDSHETTLLNGFLAAAERHGAQAPAGDESAPTPETRGSEDAIIAELAERLRGEGLTVREGYGTGGHPLDIAVADPHLPAAMVVAVESDGRRAQAWLSVRDRERLWPEQLQRAGWAHVRVWSTDVFRDPARDMARVAEAVRSTQSRGQWSHRR